MQHFARKTVLYSHVESDAIMQVITDMHSPIFAAVHKIEHNLSSRYTSNGYNPIQIHPLLNKICWTCFAKMY